MRSSKLGAGALVVLLTLAARPGSAQTVETFEGFGSCNNSTLMGVFNGIDYMKQFICYAYSQPPYNPVSPPNRIRWNVPGGPVTDAFFSFLSPTTFQGAYFAGSGPSVFFELYSSNTLVATSAVLASSSTPTFLATNYNGIVDKVRVVGNGNQIILDNLTWGGANPNSVVPEPATMTLLATGLVGMVAARRRRRKA